MERSMSCLQCKHLVDKKGANDTDWYRPKKGLCEITHRWVSLKRGNNCEKFDYLQLDKDVAEDGTEIKNRQPLDYRTENQWQESGRRLRQGAVGKEMYASRSNMKTKYRYYLIEETVKDDTK